MFDAEHSENTPTWATKLLALSSGGDAASIGLVTSEGCIQWYLCGPHLSIYIYLALMSSYCAQHGTPCSGTHPA